MFRRVLGRVHACMGAWGLWGGELVRGWVAYVEGKPRTILSRPTSVLLLCNRAMHMLSSRSQQQECASALNWHWAWPMLTNVVEQRRLVSGACWAGGGECSAGGG